MAYFALYYHPTTSCVWLPRVTNHLVWLYKKQVYTILLIFTLWIEAINMTDSFVVTCEWSIVPVMQFPFLLSTCRYTKACMAAVFSLERLWIFLTFQKYICLPICLSVCVCLLSAYLCVCLAGCVCLTSAYLSVCLFCKSSSCLFVFSVMCLSVCVPLMYQHMVCRSVGLFVCLKDCEWTVPNPHRLVSVPLLFFTHRTSGLTLQLTLWMVRVWTFPCVVLIPRLLEGEPLRAWVLGYCTSFTWCLYELLLNCVNIVAINTVSCVYFRLWTLYNAVHACEGAERGRYKGDCCGCGMQQKQQKDVRILPSLLSSSSLHPLHPPHFYLLPSLRSFLPLFLSPFLPPFLSPFFPPTFIFNSSLSCLTIMHFLSSDSQLKMRKTCALCCVSVLRYLPTLLPSKENWPSRNRTKHSSRLPKTSSATSVSHVMSHDHTDIVTWCPMTITWPSHDHHMTGMQCHTIQYCCSAGDLDVLLREIMKEAQSITKAEKYVLS